MRQRLHIARGLLHDPEILFLDEPTIGLDPVGARELRDTIARLREGGKTILLTTHYMYEADELCDRIAVIADGDSSPGHAGRSEVGCRRPDGHRDRDVRHRRRRRSTAARRCRASPRSGRRRASRRRSLLVQSARGAELVPPLLRALDGTTVGRVIAREPTLEDAYVELVREA